MKAKGVTLINLSKIYPGKKGNREVRAVDNVSLDIEPGEFVTLLGPSGCGKTTTLRMIAGFEKPSGGQQQRVARPGLSLWNREYCFLMNRFQIWMQSFGFRCVRKSGGFRRRWELQRFM